MSEPQRSSDRQGIAHRASSVMVGTLASRLLGALRDAVIAAAFPVKATDAFFVAFTIPNGLRVLLGEGAVSAAFIPVYAEVQNLEGPERARQFFASWSGVLLASVTLVTVLGMLLAPALVVAYAAGYLDEPDRFHTTVTLTRLVFPYILFAALAALGMGALNAHRRFLVPALAPGMLNVGLLIAPFVLVAPAVALGFPPIAALAGGALFGGALQVIAQFPALRAESLLGWPRFDLKDPYVRKALRLLLPLLAGLGVYQLNVTLSRLFASFLPVGAQSFLYYGQRLVEIPQGMFALAIASATLPTLSDLRTSGRENEVQDVLHYSLRLTFTVAVPATVLLVVLAEPVVAVVFGRGEFTGVQIAETARSLRWQAAGVWAVASVRTLVPIFYAYNDTRSPVVGSAINLVVFVLLGLVLMHPMSHAGIAAAISGAAVAQLVSLVVMLEHRLGRLGWRELAVSLGRVLAATSLASLLGWAVCRTGDWARGGNHLPNIAVLSLALFVSGASYFAFARILGVSELSDLYAVARRVVRR